ncbi:hypothetical protein EDEG_00485 [Edhazardia aedis USNM 41457]|uniref:Uncharacterized protein n=1 Tax=Edhazardia aedis (strain USNM 41457) TaxID=1003232 RepID=J9DFE6_EDHAE|nr:hypothetical protein EDEG_00485 [Edhazardia aedis USNM 41457]|eukprot:EJW01325.1 hypothetical protein EDEG_00485 [Edhazardia aedis USNM 41457]
MLLFALLHPTLCFFIATCRLNLYFITTYIIHLIFIKIYDKKLLQILKAIIKSSVCHIFTFLQRNLKKSFGKYKKFQNYFKKVKIRYVLLNRIVSSLIYTVFSGGIAFVTNIAF